MRTVFLQVIFGITIFINDNQVPVTSPSYIAVIPPFHTGKVTGLNRTYKDNLCIVKRILVSVFLGNSGEVIGNLW